MAAVLEDLAAEVLGDNTKGRIVPRHIQLAVRNDEELAKRVSWLAVRCMSASLAIPGLSCVHAVSSDCPHSTQAYFFGRRPPGCSVGCCWA